MNDEIAIKVDGVYKDFLLPHEQAHSLKSAFTGILKGKKGRTIERQHALHDISFEVKKGEFFGIVGRNGSGKSTLLKILAQIYLPTKGQTSIVGKLIPFIELGVGFNAELTGSENVYLSASLMGFSKKEIDAMYQDIVDFAELEKFMDQKLKNYSSGMQVRLAFSIATRARGDILLIDEVLAVGDADFQRKCFEYFRKLKKEKKTVIFVSHDMSAIREYCDRVVMIEKSKVVAEGKPDDVAIQYTKLFMNESKSGGMDSKLRWGTGELKYSKVAITPKTVKTEEHIQLTANITATELIEHPILGFSIMNAAGQQILGTNTRIKHCTIDKLEKGETQKVSWTIPNVFGDGTYTVALAAVKSDGVSECDKWEDAAKFTVFKEERTPYIITPDITVSVQSVK